ncbi:MAG: hypothetical protein EON60_05955 [Alphaproteobacteria bacterium]|nr:MAG: hypothetical protein EON60_05955 [Alphaproteobacteria bacterium]
MMKKLLGLAAATVIATTAMATSASAFQASGYMERDFDTGKSYFKITNHDTGRVFQFYGTGASCKRGGQSYDDISSMMQGGFRAKVVRCPNNPSLVILYVNDYDYYTTVSRARAFDDFGDF